MDNYKLKEDEVVLYKGYVTLLKTKENVEIILTNLNIVFILKQNSETMENNFFVETYPVENIKIYKDKPQIKIKGNEVEIYFLTTEKEFSFDSKKELHNFYNEAFNLITGKTKMQRNAEKVKNAIELVNDTLGINTVNAVSGAIKCIKPGKIIGGITNSISVIKKKKN